MAKDSIDEANVSETRREFIKAAGKLAIYAPPTLMILMRPTPNAIAASGGQFPNNDNEGSEKDGSLVGVAPEDDSSHPNFLLWR